MMVRIDSKVIDEKAQSKHKILDKGIVQEQGPAHEVIENPKMERTRQFLAHYHEN